MFVVLEGIDGAGTHTQSDILKNFLEKNGKKVLLIRYPDYGPNKENPTQPIGKIIHEFLHKKYELNTETQFLLYSTDMVKDIEKIKNALEEGKIVIADRYFISTLAYQGLQGFPLEKAIQYAKIFGLVEPDLVILLDISAETSLERKMKEKGGKVDRFEENLEFQKRLRKFYLKLAKEKIFGKKWIVIDGERSIGEVAKEIREIILDKV